MTDGITVRVLGDHGPFSRVGKSIGYQVTIGGENFLLDCGSPLFQQIGGHGLKSIAGLLVTHCHDDHKRWFTDLALFSMYAPDISRRVVVFTSEEVNEGLRRSSAPSLDTSLSIDSERIIDLEYSDYIDYRIIGPRARYRIAGNVPGKTGGGFCVIDSNGNPVGPEKAKIVISSKSGRARLLFRDPEYGEWVEPESFYGFSSKVFYEEDMNSYRTPEGFSIEAIKAPVWHGIPSIGLKFSTSEESLVFSADTVHDTELWERLYLKKRIPQHTLPAREFESATIIHGDINDYIERTWSEERYQEAIRAFDGSIAIHDISTRNSVVHTEYNNLNRTVLKKEKTILTHSPDMITSEWVLSQAGKLFRVNGESVNEIVGDSIRPLNADIYHKEHGRFFVGYKNSNGSTGVYERDGLLSLDMDETPVKGRLIYNVDLYEDIGGKYYPYLTDSSTIYIERNDEMVELVKFTAKGSVGLVVDDERKHLAKR